MASQVLPAASLQAASDRTGGLRYMARQPILDLRGQVHSYELLFRDGLENVFRGDLETASRTIVDNAVIFGLDDLAGGLPAFVNCTSRMPAYESTSPIKAPHRASKMPSVTNCRANRPRLAPIAPRIAISRRRASARASKRFATLTLAINKTNPTAPSNTSSAGRTLDTTSACNG